jgi:uncharacterized membrane protein YedE/YeeE
MRYLIAIVSGAIFGSGMLVSGMANPARVIGFFDVTSAWDPTLAFVMAGAIAPMAIAWAIRSRMQRSLVGDALPGPASSVIDTQLVFGSAVFGSGWGIAGVCPGAVIPALSVGGWPIAVFTLSMLVGMLTAQFRLPAAASTAETTPLSPQSAQGPR